MTLCARQLGCALWRGQTAARRLPAMHARQRCLGTQDDSDEPKPKVVLQKLGEFPYGSREYRLSVQRPNVDEDGAEGEATHQPIASLRAHRNIVFGAQLLEKTTKNKTLSEACLPLLDAALKDASVEGEQPQALATLHGLCNYVAESIEEEDAGSEALQKIKEYDDELLAYHAIQAIATGVPRAGHSVVGQGTYRDGEVAWESLAREFVTKNLAEEVGLYRARGGTVVSIEHLADTNPPYLKSAGGAMARLFFI